MDSGWFDATLAWISAHPVAAGGLIFLIAFCDSIVVLGIVVPALPLLFAIGALIGLGHIDGTYAVTCAALGAFMGDGIGYWVGHRGARSCATTGRSGAIRSCSTAASRCSGGTGPKAS